VWLFLELTRCADAQDDARAARPLAARWQCLEGSLKMAGNDRNLCAGHEHTDAVPERAHLAAAGACALGEKDITARFVDEATSQGVDCVMATVLPPHGEGVHHAGGEGGDGRRFEESVTGGEGKDAISQGELQSSRQDQDIKVAGVVSDNNERSGPGKMFASDDLDPFSEPEDAAHPPPPETPADQPDETSLSFDRS